MAATLLMLTACSDPAPEIPPLDRAMLALDRQDGLGAEIILRDMAARGTPMPEIAAYLGQAELQQNKVGDARRWLENTDFTPQTEGLGYHMLGRVEMAEGHLPKAGMAFDRALQTISGNPELWVDIGRLRYLGGEQKQAIEASLRALELGPNNVATLEFRTQLVRDSEGLEAALPLYEAALGRYPDSLTLLGDYGATLGESGSASDMLKIARRMIALDESNSRAFFLQAVLAARGGEFGLARNLLIRSGNLERGSPAALLLSGIIDMQQGNYASASQTLDRLERIQPDNYRIRLLAARCLALGGRHRELVHRFRDQAMVPGSPPYLAALVGRSYEAMGKRDLAAPFLDAAAKPRSTALQTMQTEIVLDVALARGPRTGGDAVAVVRGLIGVGKTARAIAHAEEFLASAPGSGDALALVGDAYLAAGQSGQAADYYAQAAAIRRSWPLTRRMVAAEKISRRTNSGLALLEHQLADNSANSEAAVMLASAELAKGNAQKAAMLLALAMTNGASRDPDAQMLRARSAMAMGDMEMARKAAIRAYCLQRMNPAATALLAEILAESGNDTAQSQALARKAANLSAR